MAMLARLDWQSDGADWPNRAASTFVPAAGFTWHMQMAGCGPDLLLVHGTGASTHSVAPLFSLLARQFRVIAPDLPGHAFSGKSRREDLSLPGMAAALKHLIDALGVTPQIVVGHSAGAAILTRMALDDFTAPRLLISINGALLPFSGLAGRIFSPLARLLVQTEVVPRVIARKGADAAAVERVLKGTGSPLDARQIELYRRLFSNPAHVQSTLDMMAQWDLRALARDLAKLTTPLLLVAGGEDEAVPPRTAFAVQELVTGARVVYLRGLGHLAHEEQPEAIAALVACEASAAGLLPDLPAAGGKAEACGGA